MLPNHRKVPGNIFEGKRVLDIGCGRNKLNGSVGLDHNAYDGVDIVANLEGPLPVPDEQFDLVFANQVLEHVRELTPLLMEIHRILKPGGQLLAHVPYFRSSWAHIDPTHVRSFTLDTLDYYVQGTWLFDVYRFSDTRFTRIEKFLDTEYPSTLGRRIFASLALKNPMRFENSVLSFMYPFEQLTFLLTK
jgi:SAM-dependent methyltransferase